MSTRHAIIVASDFSKTADRAVAKASRLAQEQKIPLAIIHVVDEGLLGSWLGSGDLSKVQERLSDHYRDYTDATFVVRKGHPAREIVRYGVEMHARLIVIGDHAPSTVEDIFLGSTARNMIAFGEIPVLVVKHDAPIAHITVATDFSDESLACGEFVRQVWPDSTTELLHIYATPGEMTRQYYGMDDATVDEWTKERRETAEKEMKSQAEQLGIGETTLKGAVSAEQEILRQTMERKSDLVALGTRGVGHFSAASTGSTADFILRASTADVLLHRS